GGNSLLFKAVVCLETTFKLSPLSKISSVQNGSRASVICFHSVVVITFALTGERSPVRNWVETVSCLRMWSVLAQVPHKTHFPRSLQFQTGQGPVLSDRKSVV